MATLITDLHGNTYRLGKFRVYLEFPKFKVVTNYAYTRDIISNTPFGYIKCRRRHWAIFSANNVYICYKLTFISYNIKKDIRHGFKY